MMLIITKEETVMGLFDFLFRKSKSAPQNVLISDGANYNCMPPERSPLKATNSMPITPNKFLPKGSDEYLNTLLPDGRTIREAQIDSYREVNTAGMRTCVSNNLHENYDFIIKHIRYSTSSPSRIYEINEPEKLFISALASMLMHENIKNKINLIRLANGTFNVNYGSHPIGKIKLTGHGTYMQIIRANSCLEYENLGLEDYIGHISKWLSYIKRLSK